MATEQIGQTSIAQKALGYAMGLLEDVWRKQTTPDWWSPDYSV